jgi:hypothetical protein
MHSILDLDLDFFVWPPFRDCHEEHRLPRSSYNYVASEDEVRSFLEKQCQLSTSKRVPGFRAEQHEEAFAVWRQWIHDGRIIAPFNVVHADAHSDLGAPIVGSPDRSRAFIEDLLEEKPEERRNPAFNEEHLHSGNYLLAAIANRWISELTYVYPANRRRAESMEVGSPFEFEDEPQEYAESITREPPAWIFQDNDCETRMIELKYRRARANSPHGTTRVEPPVPLKCIDASAFSFAGVTHLFLARSPKYTPCDADKLLDVVGEYFY